MDPVITDTSVIQTFFVVSFLAAAATHLYWRHSRVVKIMVKIKNGLW